MSHSRRWAAAIPLCISGCLALACSSVPVKLSTRAADSYDRNTGREISIRGCGLQLFYLIPIATNNRQRRAYDALVKMEPESVITDVKVQERWYFAYIGTVYCTRVSATAYSRK